MASKTLQAMIVAARDHADMQGSPFVTDPELTSRINAAGARFRRRLYQKLGGTIARSMATFASTAGVSTVDLTGISVYRLDGVDVQFDTDWYPLKKFHWRDRNTKQRVTGWNRGTTRYRLENHAEAQPRLRFIPEPNDVKSIRVWYLPGHTALVNPGDLMYLPDDYFEWVELMAARKARAKGDLDTRKIVEQLRELEGELQAQADAAEQDEGEVVHDVLGRADYDDDGFEEGLPHWLT